MYEVSAIFAKETPMDLDELLDASSPPIVERTPALSGELAAVVASSEVAVAPSRRRIRLIVAGTLAAGAVGLGSAATATGFMPAAHWPWSTSAGRSCQVSFDVELNGVGGNVVDPAPDLASMSLAERQAVLVAAREFLSSFDYASIDRQEAIARWQAGEAEARAGESADERQPKLVGDDLELTAVYAEVNRELDEYLAERGLNPNAIIPVGSSRCTP
jgi:hypothetical protein